MPKIPDDIFIEPNFSPDTLTNLGPLRHLGAIGVGQVVRLMEPDMDIVPCFNDSSGCVIEPACLLKGELAEARGAFLAALDHYTHADLAKPRRRLSALFLVEPRHA
jgi:DNA-binding IscR family transcriptional regulator